MGFDRNKLIKIRKEKNISQIMLAERIGLTSGAIGNYESGTRTPKFSTLQKLANYFNVPVAYFLDDSDLYGAGNIMYPGDALPVSPVNLFSGIGGIGSPETLARIAKLERDYAAGAGNQPEKKLQTVQTPEAMREAVVRFWAETATDDMIRDFCYIAFGNHGSDIQAQIKELAVLDHVPLDYRVSVVKNIITFYNLAQARGELVCEDLAPANLHVLVEAIRAGLDAVGEGRDSYIRAGE